ncbi:MAG: NADH-quinone oxidoreductase subunit H [Aquificae bacterium]|jgi:NADH-quinone oxidoreductase subunit H|nr:NADH-quinone oxidoreductase subunit H [Aquificota bacterium]
MDWGEILFRTLVFPGVSFLLLVIFATFYLERKLVADMHGRTGPYYVGPYGILQTVADIFKILQKEVIIHREADKVLFLVVPAFAFLMVSLVAAFIPYDKDLWIVSTPYDLIISLALLTSLPAIFLFAGWVSKSKYPFIGGIRVINQLISGEIPLWLAGLSVALWYGTFNYVEIVEKFDIIGFLVNLIGFAIFLVAILIVADRPPFDIPEAEQEIVYGFLTEYTGLGYLLLAGAKFLEVFVLAAMTVTLFLGGFKGPFLPGWAWFFIKLFFVYYLAFAIRASTPRIRLDQLIKLTWKVLVPLALLNIVLIILLKGF